MNEKIYLVVWHDRHTDDRFYAYEKLNKAIERANIIAGTYNEERYPFEDSDTGYEYCLWVNDDYNIYVQKLDIIK
jgi:hypothetical protein